MQLQISVKDSLTPYLRSRLNEIQNPRPIMAAVGKALEVELRAVYRELNAQPNKMGWPKRNFWSRRVANKIALTRVEPRRATVAIASPELLHKITGGTVFPKRAKTLAIPANAQAYRMGGPRASGKDFQFLLLAQGNLVGALLNPETYNIGSKKTGKNKGKMIGGQVMYWLVRKVTHRPDPTVSPAHPAIATRLHAAVAKAASAAIARMFPPR